MFFALWPDEGVRSALGRLSGELVEGGRPTRRDNLHMTLEFLGGIDRARIADASAAATRLSAPRFRLVLDGVGHWRRSRILWLAPTNPTPPLIALQAGLHAELAAAGLPLEDRPFRPHVTLARRAKPLAFRPVAPVTWDVRELVLAESMPGPDGVRYQVVERWPLGPDPLTGGGTQGAYMK